MKRGKRQVMERPNFDSQNQQQNNQQLFSFNNSFNQSTWNVQKQTVENNRQQNIVSQKSQSINKVQNKSPQIKKTIITQSHRQNNIQNKVNAVAGGQDDERKKRLEMLRQKYLKNSTSNQVKQQPYKKEIYKKPQQNQIKVQKTQQLSPTQIKQTQQKKQQNQYWQNTQQNQNKYQPKQQQQSDESRITNNKQSQSPISKPTQLVQVPQSRAPIPPPIPVAARRRNPPPPPQRISVEQPQKVPIKEEPINIITQPKQQQIQKYPPRPYKPAPKYQKPVQNQIFNKNQQVQNQIKSQSHSCENNTNLQQAISKWLNNPNENTYKSNQNSNKIIDYIVMQLTGNEQNNFIHGVIKHFVIKNQKGYSEQQFKFILQNIGQLTQASDFTKLYLSIKCGITGLQQHCKKLLNSNSTQLLNKLLLIKQQLNQKQLNQFIRFYLMNIKFSQQILLILTELSPSCPALHQYLLSYAFESITNIVFILLKMRHKLEQSMCPVYFKLINSVLLEVNKQNILQEILKLINNIGFQSAYQFKKDTKLKIIEKIDRLSNPNNTYTHQVPKNQSQIQYKNNINLKQSKQSQKQKGLGVINLMGYVNQAFKKITNQMPEKQANQQKSSIEEPTQKIQWDPILKRYLINGKVPQDEGSGSYYQTQQGQSQAQPKKKVPPPPPKIGRRTSQQPSQQNQSTQPIQPIQSFQNKPQIIQKQQNPFPEIQQNQQPQKTPQYPAPPRMGLKGALNKKPKIQARYT